MKQPAKGTSLWSRQFGVSAVEVLVVLGLVGVLFSFGSPMLGQAVARAELRAAADNLELSIDMARDAARRSEGAVVMHLPQPDDAVANQVSYSSPDDRADFATLTSFEFPSTIRIVASAAEVRFDYRGLVEAPVRLELFSTDDVELRQLIVVN